MLIDIYEKSEVYMICTDTSLSIIMPMILSESEFDSVIEDIEAADDISVSDFSKRHPGSQAIQFYSTFEYIRGFSRVKITDVFVRPMFTLYDKNTKEAVESYKLVMFDIEILDDITRRLPEFLYFISVYMTSYYYLCKRFIYR